MTDIPIIFSAAMIRALLDGRKTMTRRFAWKKPVTVVLDDEEVAELRRARWKVSGPDDLEQRVCWPPSPWQKVKPGDRLWVKENAWICPPHWTDTPVNPMGPDRQEVAYQADDVRGGTADAARDYKLKLRPSIHMPRWASRLTLVVTATKIERLNDISEEDATAEGVDAISLADVPRQAAWSRRQDFSRLWDRLHGAGAWDANPEIVAVAFTVHRANIDAMPRDQAA